MRPKKVGYTSTDIFPIKRWERSGSRCDYCRVTKTKCDAHVEILYKDNNIIKFLTDKLYPELRGSVLKKLLICYPDTLIF